MAAKKPPATVKPDLDNPEFRRALFAASADVQAAVIAAARQIQQMTWAEIYQSKGLHWEAITSFQPPKQWGIDPFYSIRLTKAARAVVYRRGDFMVFMALPPNHDTTYNKNWLTTNVKP